MLSSDSTARQWLPPLIAGMFTKGVELRARFPRCADGYAMMHAGAPAVDPQRALDAVAARPQAPATEQPAVWLQRAQTLVGLMARWEQLRFAIASSAIDEVPVIVDQDDAVSLLRADLLALRAAQQRRGWAAVAEAYAQIADGVSNDALPRVLNNWGYALAQSGRRELGLEKLRQAIAARKKDQWVPRLNVALLGDKKARTGEVERFVEEEGSTAAASAWEAYLRQRESRVAGAAASARAALAAMRNDEVGSPPAWGLRGVVVISAFQVGLGLSSMSEDHVLQLRVEHPLWLVDPVPVDAAALERMSAASPRPANLRDSI